MFVPVKITFISLFSIPWSGLEPRLPLPYHCKMSFFFYHTIFMFYFSFFCYLFLPPSPALPQPIASSRCKICTALWSFHQQIFSLSHSGLHPPCYRYAVLVPSVDPPLRGHGVDALLSCPPPHTHNLSISPHLPHQTSTPPSVANLSVFSLASPALLTRGNLFKDQINIRT